MDQHRHEFGENLDPHCSCGVVLCGSTSPDKNFACNLRRGHVGPCVNTIYPQNGIWDKTTPQNTPQE